MVNPFHKDKGSVMPQKNNAKYLFLRNTVAQKKNQE